MVDPSARPLSVGRARLLAFGGGLATGLACGFGIAAVVIGFAGTANPGLSVDRSRQDKTANWIEGALLSLSAAIAYGLVVTPLERRLEAAAVNDVAAAKLVGFVLLGLVPGLATGAIATLQMHGRW